MNKEDLEQAKFTNISIVNISNGRYVLVLVCDSAETAENMYGILRVNKKTIDLNIKPNKHYDLIINFTGFNLMIKHSIDATKEEYPDILLLANSKVNLLTSGYLRNEQLIWNHDYILLSRPLMN